MKRFRMLRPAHLVVLAFLFTVLMGTFLLSLPVARSGAPVEEIYQFINPGLPVEDWPEKVPVFGPSFPGGAPLSVALFTSASATSVTGLIVADTATYWSSFGQAVILWQIELGGIGTMTIVSLVAMALRRRFTDQNREVVSASVGGVPLGRIRRVLPTIAIFSIGTQLIFALILWAHFALINLGDSPLRQFGHAFFLVGSAFNNAGFAPYSDSLVGFTSDPWVIICLAALIMLGGLGFPVYVVLSTRGRKWWRWDMNTRIMLSGTAVLVLGGWAMIALLEWNNPGTIGNSATGTKLLSSFFSSVTPRTAGFNSMDISQQFPETWLVTDLLMFIGAGPAGTAGGIKITTAVVLLATLCGEIRGATAINILGLRLARSAQRQALAVFALFGLLIAVGTFFLMLATPYTLNQSLYEVSSALATVGLTTGITPTLPVGIQLMLILLMMVGRIGPLALATTIATRKKVIGYELPRDHPLIG